MEGRKLEEDKQGLKSGWSIAGLIAIILAVINPFAIMWVSKTGFTVGQIGTLGTVGDFFGGTTVGLLSLASILFVIHTIGIQRKELELTREEFKTGNTTAKVQQVDNAFFNMLSLHHQIVNNISITNSKPHQPIDTYHGREAIEILREIYDSRIGGNQFLADNPGMKIGDWQQLDQKKYIKYLLSKEDSIDEDVLNKVYKGFHNEYGNDIGHYMRFNYRIVKFIVNNVVNDENEQKKILEETGRDTIIGDRRYYFGMLRAQWSNAEFELILINSLYSENRKFKELILKYDVLDIEDAENKSDVFKLKDSMNKFKAYRKLIEVKK